MSGIIRLNNDHIGFKVGFVSAEDAQGYKARIVQQLRADGYVVVEGRGYHDRRG